MSVYDEIRAERETHIARGYDTTHDDAHSTDSLVYWAFVYATKGDRKNLIKASSVLVAAIERHDRNDDAVLRQPLDTTGA